MEVLSVGNIRTHYTGRGGSQFKMANVAYTSPSSRTQLLRSSGKYKSMSISYCLRSLISSLLHKINDWVWHIIMQKYPLQ